MPIDSKKVLVVGGAGYIGSHMLFSLKAAGFYPIVLDNLSKGHKHAVLDTPLYVADMADKAALTDLFDQHDFSAVMHFASFIEVGESVKHPGLYYQNNVSATLNLLEVMLQKNVKTFIFSSTAAVYGEPSYTPIDEAHPLAPINPYGSSKWMVEHILKDYAKSDQLQFAILRYFNAAGADPKGRLREEHHPETHLIPLVLQVANGERDNITIYGDDYPTPDGTCIRDYVHVSDLCDAHLLALQALKENRPNRVLNLGNGAGYSVLEVIQAARRITQHPIPAVIGARRQGDPAILVADASLAMKELNWRPRFRELDPIITHAFQALALKA